MEHGCSGTCPAEGGFLRPYLRALVALLSCSMCAKVFFGVVKHVDIALACSREIDHFRTIELRERIMEHGCSGTCPAEGGFLRPYLRALVALLSCSMCVRVSSASSSTSLLLWRAVMKSIISGRYSSEK